MKTFESQLLELLREYDEAKPMTVKENGMYDFYFWLSKRVEEKEEEVILKCNHTVDLSQFTQYGQHCYSVCQECKKVFEVDMVKFLKEAL